MNQVVTSLQRLRQLCSGKRKSRNQLFDMPVLGLAGCHWRKIEIEMAGTLGWSDPVSHDCGSFVECGPAIMPHPPACKKQVKSEVNSKTEVEVLHLFRWFTNTPSRRRVEKLRPGQWHEIEEEGKWKWGEGENEMKVTQPGREEGNAKEEGRRKHQHMKPSPKRANPGKAREKKSEGRRTRNKTSGGGGGRKRLNQPNTAKTYAYLGTRRTQHTCRGENTWNMGPMWN